MTNTGMIDGLTYTIEIGAFEFDLPEQATVTAQVSTPNPLFSDMRVMTRWQIELGRFTISAALSAAHDLQDLSRRAFDSGLRARGMNTNGVPGLCSGNYETAHAEHEFWFSLNGLTLMLSLQTTKPMQIVPTDDERRTHAAIISSVRRVGRNGR